MEDQEVNPAQPGEGEVLSDVVPESVAAPKKRGRGVDRASLTPDELKAHKKDIDTKHQNKRKAQGFVYSSTDEPTKPQALALLEERGIKHPHIQSTVHKLLLRAAEDNHITPNRYLFAHGITPALASYQKKEAQPAEPISAENIPGELLTRAELFALYDASISTHEEISFEEFLQIRFRCKSDTFYLGKEVFQNDFAHAHEVWRDFFPQLNPTTLPPNYTQRQAINWLASQSEIKDFLLMASRRAFKSSFARLWLVSAIVTLPDIRILIVSETRPLAKDNIEAVRGYFEATPGFETRFQRLFPEFCIPVGDGSVMSLEVPTRRLKLPQSVESSSMDSTVAGRRADVILFDDCISEVSCTNEVQIQKSVNKRDLLVKLKERGGLVITLGTPYAAKDLYFEMIERSEKNGDETFAYRVDPAFQVKPEARYKLTPTLLPTLVEEDIESFLFPEGLPWKELRTDLRNNPPFFMSQNLCIFPLEEDADIKVTFEEAVLRSKIRHRGFFDATSLPGTPTYMATDDATSVSRYADFSAIAIVRVQPVQKSVEVVDSKQHALVVLDLVLGRWKQSEKITNICKAIEKHKPSAWVLEKDRGHEELVLGVRKMCVLKGLTMPHVMLRDIKNTPAAKALKVKVLEAPLEDNRLFFASAPWNDAMIERFIRFDGIKKSGSSDQSKDDDIDAIATAYQVWGPRPASEVVDPKDGEERRLQEEEEGRQMRKAAHYNTHFGPYGGTRLHPAPPAVHAPTWREVARGTREPEVAPEPAPQDPRLRVFGNRGPWRL
jgi:hypothetical protein